MSYKGTYILTAWIEKGRTFFKNTQILGWINNLARVTPYLNFGLASRALCFILLLLLLLITLVSLQLLQFFILLLGLISFYKICMDQKCDFGSVLLSCCWCQFHTVIFFSLFTKGSVFQYNDVHVFPPSPAACRDSGS